MTKHYDLLSLLLLIINIIFLLYYSSQLLFFTDEFAIKNLGMFNHSIAGLCEVIGIIFFSLSFGLLLTIIKGPKNQIILYFTIFILQLMISINFWRYIITDHPGETSIKSISFNAVICTIMTLSILIFLIRMRKKLK
tara:strand:+ start:106 stop:516 length:411 start_codon:yes stop_codon:yes gene_type:complete